MPKYRVLQQSLINYPLPMGPVVRQPGDIVELPDDAEVHNNLESVSESTPVTPLHGSGKPTTPTHIGKAISGTDPHAPVSNAGALASNEAAKKLLPPQPGLL
jgi:hypothetical protein